VKSAIIIAIHSTIFHVIHWGLRAIVFSLAKLNAADAAKKEIDAAKNELEAFVYNTRTKLSDEGALALVIMCANNQRDLSL